MKTEKRKSVLISFFMAMIIAAFAPLAHGQQVSAPNKGNGGEPGREDIYKIMTPAPNLAARGIFPGEISVILENPYPSGKTSSISAYEVSVAAAATGTPETRVTVWTERRAIDVNPSGSIIAEANWKLEKTIELLLFGTAAGVDKTITVRGYKTENIAGKPDYAWSKSVSAPRDKLPQVALPQDPAGALAVSSLPLRGAFDRQINVEGVLSDDPAAPEIIQGEGVLEVTDARTEPPRIDAPLAMAAAPRAAETGGRVPLDGTASKGGGLNYLWEQVRGPKADIENAGSAGAAFTPGRPGLYRFRLTVSNTAGKSAAEIDVNVPGPSDLKLELAANVTMESPAASINIDGDRLVVLSKSEPWISVYDISDPARPLRKRKYVLPFATDSDFFYSDMYRNSILALTRKKTITDAMHENVRMLSLSFDEKENLALTSEKEIGERFGDFARDGDSMYAWSTGHEPNSEKGGAQIIKYDVTDASRPREEWREGLKTLAQAIPTGNGRVLAIVFPGTAKIKNEAPIDTAVLGADVKGAVYCLWETKDGTYTLISPSAPDAKFSVQKFSAPAVFKTLGAFPIPGEYIEFGAKAAGSTVFFFKQDKKESDGFTIYIVDVSDPAAPVEKASIPIPGKINAIAADGRLLAVSYMRQLRIYRLY